MEVNVDDKYQQKVDLEPENSIHWVEWGTALFNQKRFDEAMLRYSQAINLDPGCSEAYFLWGMILFIQRENYDEAIKKQELAIQSKSDFFLAKIALVITIKLAFQTQGQEKYQKKVIEHNSIFEQVQEELDLLRRKTHSKKSISNVSLFDSNVKQIDQEQEAIYQQNSLSEYYEFLRQGFHSIFIFAFADGLNQYIPRSHGTLIIASEWLQTVFPANIMRIMIEAQGGRLTKGEVKALNDNFQKFRKEFDSFDEVTQIVEKIARSLTLYRKSLLTRSHAKERSQESSNNFTEVKEFFAKEELRSRSEKYAFIDFGVILRGCFIEGLTLEKQKNKKEARQGLAAVIIRTVLEHDKGKQESEKVEFEDDKKARKPGCCNGCALF